MPRLLLCEELYGHGIPALAVLYENTMSIWSSYSIYCELKAYRRERERIDLTVMPGLTTLPPFPDDVPTHPLPVIDYELIHAHNEEEIERLWRAATELGFW